MGLEDGVYTAVITDNLFIEPFVWGVSVGLVTWVGVNFLLLVIVLIKNSLTGKA